MQRSTVPALFLDREQGSLTILCLCAEWCGVCRAFAEEFGQLQVSLPAHRFLWVDVEDDEAVVADVEVQTFPTIVLASGGEVLFAGPVQPSSIAVSRLVRAAETGSFAGATLPGNAQYKELARRAAVVASGRQT